MVTLLNTKMRVDGGIPGGSCEVLSLPVRDVLAVPLDVPLGQAEINHKNLMCGLVEPNAEVIRFDIPMNEVPVVDVFDPADHLVDEHEHRFEGELAEGVLEE